MSVVESILLKLESLGSQKNREGMARFGIRTDQAYGVSMPLLRKMAREYRPNHDLAQALWKRGFHETRILAFLIDDPKEVTQKQMASWVLDFDSWDICDGACGTLFDKTPWAYETALRWSARSSEFVRRAGYVMMAVLAVHDKKAKDEKFLTFLKRIEKGAGDERNFVKKAVNWALRQIGKRNLYLHGKAIGSARRIRSHGALWVAADALRELNNPKTIGMVERKSKKAKSG